MEHLCFQAYDECNYGGRCLSICGKFPDIPEPLQHFVIKSVKIPAGVRINFYAETNFQGEERITLEGEDACLSHPFEISLLSKEKLMMVIEETIQILKYRIIEFILSFKSNLIYFFLRNQPFYQILLSYDHNQGIDGISSRSTS